MADLKGQKGLHLFMLFMTKNSDLVKNDFKIISLKKEIPLKIKDIRNSIVAIQELATCSLMKLEKINSRALQDVDDLAFQIQSIVNEVDIKTSAIGDILDDLSPSEHICESCFEEVNLHCPCCHRFNEDLRTGYCNTCVEANREQVYL